MTEANHEAMKTSLHRKSLHDLENSYFNYKNKGIPDTEREIGLLEAQIAGLLEHKPDGFGGRVEMFRKEVERNQSQMAQYVKQIAALEDVIAEKQAALEE